MSTAELKETVDRLSKEERTWLRRYLTLRERIEDPAFLADITRRAREMEEGKFLTREEVLAIHEKLKAEGR